MPKRIVTDKELLADMREGLSASQIAKKWSMTPGSVRKRRRRLQFQATTIAVLSKPVAETLVAKELDTISALQESLQRLMRLSDAYHEWLLDPDHDAAYAIGPRASEIEVVYTEPGVEGRSKTTLQELLNRAGDHIHVKRVKICSADPRIELRNAIADICTLTGQIVDLTQMLSDMRSMQVLRDSILEELQKVDGEFAARITSALRSRLVVSGTH